MKPNMLRRTSVLSILLALESSNAQGETVNVCGKTYEDAEANCGSNPSCGSLKCPNHALLAKPGGASMLCFAVPTEKCHFGPPKSKPDVPTELDPNNTNYCGPIVGGWQLAVDYCSPSTACPGGSPDECEEGWTCYGGVTCDPSSKSNTDTIDAPPGVPEDVVILDTSVDIKEVSTNSDTEDEAAEISPVASNTDETSAADGNVGYCGPAGALGRKRAVTMCSRSTMCGPDGACPAGMVCYGSILCHGIHEVPISSTSTTETASSSPESSVDSNTDTQSDHYYCGPNPTVDHQAWQSAFEQCSPETSCANDRLCPGDQICYGGIDCSAKQSVTTEASSLHYYCGPNPTVDPQAWKTAFEQCSPETSCANDRLCPGDQICFGGINCSAKSSAIAGTNPPDLIPVDYDVDFQADIPSGRYYCGPDPTVDHQAWTRAFEQCSPETSCANDRTCPGDQICYGGIDCLGKTSANAETSSTNTDATLSDHYYCGPNPAIDHQAWESAFETCSPQTSCANDRLCPGDQICFGGIDCSAKQAAIVQDDTSTNASAETVISDAITDDFSDVNRYCGPNPHTNSDGWMTALANCSPQTACGDGRPCRDGQYCYEGINCSMKDSFYQPPVLEEESTMTSSTTTTTTKATSAPVIPESAAADETLEDNEFFCGPVGDGGWLKAAELCKPCPNGDPAKCGPEMTCYSGVTSCAEQKSQADETLLEVEGGRVHIGHCGTSFYDARDNCATNRPCTLDEECDEWHPQCYAVRCEETSVPAFDISPGGSSPEDGTVTVLSSFCGAWHEEASSQCTAKAPCKTTNDCSGIDGCFSDIKCKFDEESPEFEAFLAILGDLEEKYPDSVNSNLRPRPSDITLEARSSAMGLFLSGATIIFPAVAAFLM